MWQAKGSKLAKNEYISRIVLCKLCGIDWVVHGYLELRATAQCFQTAYIIKTIQVRLGLNMTKLLSILYTVSQDSLLTRKTARTWGLRGPCEVMWDPSLSLPYCMSWIIFFFWKICLLLWKTGMLLLLIKTYWKINVFHIPFIVGEKKASL